MITAASSQLGPHWSQSLGDHVTDSLEAGRRVQIQALDEERAQMATQILRDRHDRVRKPVKAVGRKLVCSDSKSEASEEGQLERFSQKFMKILFQRLPITKWILGLSWSTFRADVIAGVTVGVMAIPQSMSYAKIAGLPYVIGLYSACMPTIIYAIFGQSRQLAVGPVAMVSLLVEAGLQGLLTEEQCPEWYARSSEDNMKQQYEFCPEPYTQLAIMTAMVVGVIQILSCFLRLGFIVSFLGHAVISGFTSAAAIIIGLSQVKYILGFDIAKSELVYETLWNIASNIKETQPMTLALGLVWFACLFVTKRLAGKYKRLSLLGALGPLISCVAGIVLVWLCAPLRDEFNIAYVGEIKDGLFPLTVNLWHLEDLSKVLPTAVTVCLIGYMESIAISKNLAAKHGYEVEPSQELLALGMSNFIGAMFSCYPVTGSFSRSAVNNATGAMSQLAGLVTGIIIFFVLMFLTSLFYYLPKFVLAAIVMNSILALIAFGEARKLWRVKKGDFLLWIVAFLGTLFLGVLLGIVVAVALSLCIIIYESARPQITILWRIPGTSIYRNVKQESSGSFVPNVFIARIGSSMYFANASFIKDMLLTYTNDLVQINATEYIVLEMTPVVSIDLTAVHCLQDIVHHFRSQGIQVAFAMVGNRVEKTMRKAELTKFVGKEWFFHTVDEAVQYCVQHQQLRRRDQVAPQQLEDVDAAAGSEHEARISTVAHPQSEISISNDGDHKCTVVLISRPFSAANSRRSIVGHVMSAFDDLNVFVTKTRVEVSESNLEKHLYCVQDASVKGPLSDANICRLREVLSVLLGQQPIPLSSELVFAETSEPSSQGGESEQREMIQHESV